jgi:hypothetical protein
MKIRPVVFELLCVYRRTDILKPTDAFYFATSHWKRANIDIIPCEPVWSTFHTSFNRILGQLKHRRQFLAFVSPLNRSGDNLLFVFIIFLFYLLFFMLFFLSSIASILYYSLISIFPPFLFSTTSRPALEPTQPPTQRVPGALSPGVKRPEREA